MTNYKYDYYGLLAYTYDVWRDDSSDNADRDFFLDIVRKHGQPALDVGCGTGRIILDYLAEGIDIDGLDNSPEMLEICNTKAKKIGLSPVLYQQRMEVLDLPRTYRTIFATSCAVQMLTDLEVAHKAFRRFFSYLQPGGAFVTSFGFEWREDDPLDTGWKLLFEKPRPEDGAIVHSWLREWHEPRLQLWHSEQRFQIELNGRIIQAEHQRRSPKGRWYTQAQAIQLFSDAGFINIQLFHEFTHEPAREDDRLFCALGVKP
jgi:ubiquinone/menaquinone biosynthesis C-methylase UbiE